MQSAMTDTIGLVAESYSGIDKTENKHSEANPHEGQVDATELKVNVEESQGSGVERKEDGTKQKASDVVATILESENVSKYVPINLRENLENQTENGDNASVDVNKTAEMETVVGSKGKKTENLEGIKSDEEKINITEVKRSKSVEELRNMFEKNVVDCSKREQKDNEVKILSTETGADKEEEKHIREITKEVNLEIARRNNIECRKKTGAEESKNPELTAKSEKELHIAEEEEEFDSSSSSGDEVDGKAGEDDGVSYTSADLNAGLNNDAAKEVTEDKKEAMLEFVKKGSDLTKVRSRTRRYTRFFRVDYSGVMLTYLGSKRSLCAGRSEEKSQVYMNSIKEVREGLMSDTFDKSFPTERFAPDASRCFSLVIGEDNETLDLVAPDAQTQKMWVSSLRFLIKKFSEENLENIQHVFLKALFRKADKNGDGTLCLKEVIKLLKRLNLQVDTDHAARLFHTANSKHVRNNTGEECLDPDEFTKFVEVIMKREELEELFRKYDNKTNYLTAPDLVNFFEVEQEEKVSLNRCKKMIEQCESCPSVRESEKLSLSGFYALFNSKWMDVKRPECRKVYQDMQQPLSHYFIDSSHNTYLAEDQLRGPSRVESYIHALKMGCRCVELDVWDGDKGEPVIYHGYTITSKILLRDTLEAIKEYAFVASDYPVILSVENHLSLDQQEKMARYFRTIFKERLLTTPLPPEAKCLPTPEQLKGMIVIKGKKLPAVEHSLSNDSGDGFFFDDEVSDEDEAASMDDDEVHRQVEAHKNSEHHKQKLSKNLSDCVIICQSASFKSFEQTRATSTFQQMSSLVESKAMELAKDQGPQFVKHNCWQLTRIYPSGLRTDSSNYDPVPLWTAGCQIVAMNYQTDDVPMFLNKGMFEENGRCGYVLKPQFMRTGTGRYNPNGPYVEQWKRILTVKIISGYQLPKKKYDREDSILDPYVKVSIHGVEEDCKKYKTKVISNNGFHPVWNETVRFEVSCPEMALILFRVYDHETRSRNVAVCQYCLPVKALQTGYRVVHLKGLSGEPLVAASLLVHISLSQPSTANSTDTATAANRPVSRP